jgi:hypothetical protein
MDQSNFMMALLIPGPSSPGKDFDMFMEPLVEELVFLWNGVSTYNALSPTKFDLCVAIIWCIHDFPALHTLSGRITTGYQACVRCDKNPCSKRIRNKICFILLMNASFKDSKHMAATSFSKEFYWQAS